MSTSETFHAHVAGDPIPCKPNAIVQAILRNGYHSDAREASLYAWGKLEHPAFEIVEWRYADQSAAPPVEEKDEQARREQEFDNMEAMREKARIEARQGIHELHSPDGELIAKFQWEEEKGDRDTGMPGWACWVVTNDSPPVILQSEHDAELATLREEKATMLTVIKEARYAIEFLRDSYCCGDSKTAEAAISALKPYLP